MHVLRKSAALAVFYIVAFAGIIVLQFKNDFIISEKLGNLHITMFESPSGESGADIQNKFSATMNGLSFSTDDDNPVSAVIGGETKPVTLTAWKRNTDLSAELIFTDDIAVSLTMSDDTAMGQLHVAARLPAGASSLSIPYGVASGAEVLSLTDQNLLVTGKKSAWELSAPEIRDGRIVLTERAPAASYSYFDRSQAFSFTAVSASEADYERAVENLKAGLIAAFEPAVSNAAMITEQAVISYIAAMAETGRYTEAVDAVPQSFRRSASRTYLSAPYFDSLARMNETLSRQLRQLGDAIERSARSFAPSVFSADGVLDYMCIYPNSASVRSVLTAAASADTAALSVQQAADILRACVELSRRNKDLAALIQPAAPGCVDRIESACKLDGADVTISEKGSFLSVVQAVKVGDAVLQYGRLSRDPGLENGGRLIISSYLKGCAAFDLRTLADLYPAVVHDNSYYPHGEILSSEGGEAVWAWTCAEDVGYERSASGTVTLSVRFPETYTHYLIVRGIRPFQSIYIYDMAYRTDPRFETYNSSGYVYDAGTNALLLKSRQKAALETVRLVYAAPAPKPARETPPPESEKPQPAQPAQSETPPQSESAQSAAAGAETAAAQSASASAAGLPEQPES